MMNNEIKMPANFAAIDENEMVYLQGKIRQKMPPRPLHKPERLCYDKAEKSVWQSQPQGDVLDV